MSWRSGAAIAGVIAFFFYANHLLTRPVQNEEVRLHEPAAVGELAAVGARTARESNEKQNEKQKVLREMASFVAAHPEVISNQDHPRPAIPLDHDRSAPNVLGAFLDQKTADDLLTREGLDAFSQKWRGAENLAPALQDLNQAWAQVGQDDWVRRKALLGVNRGLAGATPESSLRESMLREFDTYHAESNPNRNPDYASQALQDFLDHEPSEEKRIEELKKRGIPVYRVPASVDAPSVK